MAKLDTGKDLDSDGSCRMMTMPKGSKIIVGYCAREGSPLCLKYDGSNGSCTARNYFYEEQKTLTC